MQKPLYIAFVWHMHQPYYKNPLTGEISMPWARLHAVKDYLNMAQLLETFPAIHQTFNLVPSLIDQIQDYNRDELPDEKFLKLSCKAAKDLDPQERKFILLNFFMANWDTMVLPLARYRDLLLKRGKFISPEYAQRIAGSFKTQDYLDLQVLFNLSWFDPTFRNNDGQLKEITQKGSNFTEDDKSVVIKKQIEIIKKVIPTYKKLQDKGQIEVSVSPYYHPILPLLCDSNSARIGMPRAKMPEKIFFHPEDAEWHVESAVKRYKEVFNKRPAGMWPSEGSVSEAMLPILIKNDIKWVATDEDILLKSLNRPRTADLLYRPYALRRASAGVNIIFRDHGLSDLVGFTYQNAPAARAVDDFISNLHNIREALAHSAGNFLVPVILDGENAWEYYPNNGRDFLSLLYLRLSEEEPLLKTTTVSDFLSANPPREEIARLYPGSWINSNFSTWIGQEEKNLSWDCLSATRDDLVNFQRDHAGSVDAEKLARAWRQIYIAEGSDWNWWYGPQNSSSCDEEFDRLYRTHLANVYEIIKQPVPGNLEMPIMAKYARPARTARGLMTPVIDGLDTTYYEWLEAACFEVGTCGGTMHRTQSIIEKICCGFDLRTLFIKVALRLPEQFAQNKESIKLVVSKFPPSELRLEIPVFGSGQKLKASLYARSANGDWKFVKDIEDIAYKKILELGIKFADLEIKQGEEFKLAFFVEENGLLLERQPDSGPIKLICPTADYEAYNWTV